MQPQNMQMLMQSNLNVGFIILATLLWTYYMSVSMLKNKWYPNKPILSKTIIALMVFTMLSIAFIHSCILADISIYFIIASTAFAMYFIIQIE